MLVFSLVVFFALFGVVAAKPESQVMIVFLFFSLVLGAVINLTLVRFAPGVPYTVVVFAVGAIISFVFDAFPDSDPLKQSEILWNGFEPELLLYIFLPVLLFGEAMSLNFYHVKGAVIPAAVLAGPGVLFGTFLMACVAKFMLPYDWHWNLCFIFGAIMSATDPVAAVALLKSVGASNSLTYMIIGESLMNDGTALVLYGLFITLIEVGSGPVFSVSDVAIFFLKVIFISPLLGFAFGVGSLLFLTTANHRLKEEDTIVQMATTICCAYLSFFVAEYVVGVSGVICCCAAAITLSCYAQPLFLKPESIHTIWCAFEWIGNTLIFTFAGSIIGSHSLPYVMASDLASVLLVYIFTFAIRALTLLFSYPIISQPSLGKPPSPQEALFTTWVGLRGAVSMALALSLLHSAEKDELTISKRDAHLVFFLVGGEVAMNLLINATTASWLLDRLKLIDTEQTAERVMMFNFVRKRIRVKAAELLAQLKESRPDQIDVELVTSYCSILRTYDCDERDESRESHSGSFSFDDRDRSVSIDVSRRSSNADTSVSPLHRGSAESLAMSSPLAVRGKPQRRHSDIIHDDAEEVHRIPLSFDRQQPLPALMARIRRAFLEVVRVSYRHQINSGKLPRNASCVLVLLNSVEAALEHVDTPGMADWTIIEQKYRRYLLTTEDGNEGEFSHLADSRMDRDRLDRFERQMQDYRDAQVIYLLTSFIEAHNYAQKRIPNYLGETYSIDTPEEASVVAESREVVGKAKAYLSAMNPQVVTLQVSKQTARWILHRQEDQVEGFQQEGIILEADAEVLLHQAAADLKVLGQVEWTDVAAAVGQRVVDSFRCRVLTETAGAPLKLSMSEL